MTLRTRLLLALIGMVSIGLVVTDLVTYTQLRSFLLARIDPQLHGTSFAVSRVLEARAGIGPPLHFTTGTGPPGTVTVSGGQFHGRTRTQFSIGNQSVAGSFGEFGELVSAKGSLVGKPLPSFFGSHPPPPPVLPDPLPTVGKVGYVIFDASSANPGSVTYRVLIRPAAGHDVTEVVAVPLTDVDDTLGRLRGTELAVSALVLLTLGALAWAVVRRGLRPLADMGAAAGEIAGGDLTRRVTPADDRTEVGRLGVALNGMLAEIEAAFAARAASEERLRHFLADASHELRTPLTSIRGYAELFDLGARHRPADLESTMHHIHDEAARMGVLVDDLLLLARLDEERALQRQPVDLAEVVRRSVAARRVASPDQAVLVDAPPTLVVECDGPRMRQVIDNLLVNADRYSPRGAPIEVRLSAPGGQVLLEVLDHGPGVPPELATRIFEPFFRPDASRARQTGGAGLGLAIVAAIARAHGGVVGVGVTPGGGARFHVLVPGAVPPTTPTSPQPPEPQLNHSRAMAGRQEPEAN